MGFADAHVCSTELKSKPTVIFVLKQGQGSPAPQTGEQCAWSVLGIVAAGFVSPGHNKDRNRIQLFEAL